MDAQVVTLHVRRDVVITPRGWLDEPPSYAPAQPAPIILLERALDLRQARRGTRFPTIVVGLLLVASAMASAARVVRGAPPAELRLSLATDVPEAGAILPAKGASDDIARAADRLLAAGSMTISYGRELNGSPSLAVSGSVDIANRRADISVTRTDTATHTLELRQIGADVFARSAEPAAFLTGATRPGAWVVLVDANAGAVRVLTGGELGWEGVLKLMAFVPARTVHATTSKDEGANTAVDGVIDLALIPTGDTRYDDLRNLGARRLPFDAMIDGNGRLVAVSISVPGAGHLRIDASRLGETVEVEPPVFA